MAEVHHHNAPEVRSGGGGNGGIYAILVIIVVLIVGAVLYFSGVLGPRADADGDDIDADVRIEAPEMPDVDVPDEVRIETPDIEVPDTVRVTD